MRTWSINLLMSLLSAGYCAIASADSLVLQQTIELRDVHGRIDHMDFDAATKRLYVAALGSGSIEVIDLKASKRTSRIEGLSEPQGVRYLASAGRLVVSEGGANAVNVYADGRRVITMSDLADADNVRLDVASGDVYVGYTSALALIDPMSLQVRRRIVLSGHPEAFELASSSPAIYVNVPTAHHIAVIDRISSKVTATWHVDDASQNFAMAFDEPHHRLFIATRQPATLQVYDATNGKRVAALAICGDVDDLFFDGARLQLYAVCGEGAVDVVRQEDADHYRAVDRVPTSPGARTGFFVPTLSTLFVATPSRAGSQAAIRVYHVQ